VRLSQFFALMSLIFSMMAVAALAQDKPDPRIYITPQNQPEAQNSPDYRNPPEQPESPDYRNQVQDSPDYGTQRPAEMQPSPPAHPGPPQNWTPEAIAYLGQNASSRTEFNLDHSMVVLASKMDQDDTDFRRVIAGIDGVSVHHFRFPGDGMYDLRILAEVRQEYRAAGWQHVSASHARNGARGETEVWVRLDNMTIRNVAVLVAGPSQVNFVSVSCAISPIDLVRLGGHFGIPQIQGGVVLPRARNNARDYPVQPQGY
jgi:hypothetical protein